MLKLKEHEFCVFSLMQIIIISCMLICTVYSSHGPSRCANSIYHIKLNIFKNASLWETVIKELTSSILTVKVNMNYQIHMW